MDCIIGLADWERMVKQTVVLDFKLWFDIVALARKDRVEEGDFNTKELAKRVRVDFVRMLCLSCASMEPAA